MLKIVMRYILVYENRKDEESAKSSVMDLTPIFLCINFANVDKQYNNIYNLKYRECCKKRWERDYEGTD